MARHAEQKLSRTLDGRDGLVGNDVGVVEVECEHGLGAGPQPGHTGLENGDTRAAVRPNHDDACANGRAKWLVQGCGSNKVGCAHDHLIFVVKLVDANLAEGVVVEVAEGATGGEALHEVARVDAEDVHHGDAHCHGQLDTLKILSVSICHKGEKGKTIQSKRSRGNGEWPHLFVVANNAVEVTADTG